MKKMKQCKTCSKEIGISAKYCPGCGAKNKKPIYKRVWLWIIAFFIAIGVTAAGSDSGNVEPVQEISQSISENTIAENESEDNILIEDKVEDTAPIEDKVEEKVPTEYKSALKKAKSYSDIMNMSKAGIYNQLTSEYGEKFSAEAAQYAIDNVEVDWKENALKKAKLYQETMAMSPNAIYNQLTSEFGEMFTAEEAQYAIDNLE